MIHRCGRLLEVLVVIISQVLVRITIDKECCNEPDEQHERNHNCHDHVSDLITKVHEHCHDVISLCKSEYAYYSFEQEYEEVAGVAAFVHGVNEQANSKLDHCNDRENDRRSLHTPLELSIIHMMLEGNFCRYS